MRTHGLKPIQARHALQLPAKMRASDVASVSSAPARAVCCCHCNGLHMNSLPQRDHPQDVHMLCCYYSEARGQAAPFR